MDLGDVRRKKSLFLGKIVDELVAIDTTNGTIAKIK
jgi:hypothetical protein